jgi:hypothetical protein
VVSPGSPVNIGYWESFNDVAGSSDININAGGTSTVTLKIYYQYVPPAFAWYDVPTLGTSLYSLSPFNPLAYTNALVNNSNATGVFTFYAACLGLTTCRVPVNFVINETPLAYQDTIAACEYAVGANNGIFDLTTMNDSVSGNNLAASVEYFGDQALITPVAFPTNDTSSSNFIYSKVFYPSTGCFSSDSLYLDVRSIPQFTLQCLQEVLVRLFRWISLRCFLFFQQQEMILYFLKILCIVCHLLEILIRLPMPIHFIGGADKYRISLR